MGYAENCLSAALVNLGQEVHIVASNRQLPYPNYREAYEAFLGPNEQPVGESCYRGARVIRLALGAVARRAYLKGLIGVLARLRPDIVQCITIPALSTRQAAIAKIRYGFKLFLEEHIHASVYPPPGTLADQARRLMFRLIVGPAIALLSERCYAIAPDVVRIATEEFGYDTRKIELSPLGVDTSLFFPVRDARTAAERSGVRARLGFQDGDVVCVYSGRFSADKSPVYLAEALRRLQARGLSRVKGLFIGGGSAAEVASLTSADVCVVHHFVPHAELPPLFRAADIGVWPKQESLSQLDAMASGLPIILSNRVQLPERTGECGLTYAEGDAEDLAQAIATLAANPELRRKKGDAAVERAKSLSWDIIARRRLRDYESRLR